MKWQNRKWAIQENWQRLDKIDVYCNKQGRKSAKHTKHTFSVYMKCIILQEISSTKTRSRILSKVFFHLPLISSTGSILKYPSIYFSILSRLIRTQTSTQLLILVEAEMTNEIKIVPEKTFILCWGLVLKLLWIWDGKGKRKNEFLSIMGFSVKSNEQQLCVHVKIRWDRKLNGIVPLFCVGKCDLRLIFGGKGKGLRIILQIYALRWELRYL